MSDIPKKFKDVDALAKAYESLEKDYTRKCQEVKRLRREAMVDLTEYPRRFRVEYRDRALNQIVVIIPANFWSDILTLAFSAQYKKAEWKLVSIRAMFDDGPDKGEPYDRVKFWKEADLNE